MKSSVIIFIIATFISEVIAVPFSLDKPSNALREVTKPPTDYKPATPFCRIFKGPSRCVDEPLPIEDKEPWCPYRMCAPSYVPADLCPVNRDVQATDKCKVEKVIRDIYKCDGKSYSHHYVPIGCTKGTVGCDYVPTCSCVKLMDQETHVLTHLAPFKPECIP